MTNEDIKQEIERLKREQAVADERRELAKEVNKLRAMKWEREHPRLAHFRRFMTGFGLRGIR